MTSREGRFSASSVVEVAELTCRERARGRRRFGYDETPNADDRNSKVGEFVRLTLQENNEKEREKGEQQELQRLEPAILEIKE